MAQSALVTGASSGIGQELAKLLARDKHDLILVARNAQALESLAAELRQAHGIAVHVLPKDLALAASPQEIADELRRRDLAIDVLVNNAGFGLHGPFHEQDVRAQLDLLQVNVTALTHLTRLLLPEMVRRNQGRVLNVASTAAFVPGALMALYYASKAYVLSFSQAIDAELDPRGNVRVTALCPGPTVTDFQRRARIENTAMCRANLMDAATVARIGYRAMLKGRPVAIAGLKNTFLINLIRFAPRGVVVSMTKRMNSDRQVK